MVKENARNEERNIGKEKRNGSKGVMKEEITRIIFPETPNLCIS